MHEKLLFVDDEPALLDGIKRQLRKIFPVVTAQSGQEALQLLAKDTAIAVVISDLRMPGMDGNELLKRVREKYPDKIRIMLSGNADLDAAIEAVNSGQIFQFLTKPCDQEGLKNTLSLAVRHFQLTRAERDLLNNTLKGSILMLSELLSLANSTAFSSGFRVKKIVTHIARSLNLKPLWQYEVAALLSQVGCVSIPQDILEKTAAGSRLTAQEENMFKDHPRIGAKLVGQIPRLEKIASIIAHQQSDHDQLTAAPELEKDVILGAEILHAALDYDRLRSRGLDHGQILQQLSAQPGRYNPDILKHSNECDSSKAGHKIITISYNDLLPGMIAAEDIKAQNGAMIIARGQEITWPVLQGLENFIDHIGIVEPIKVWSE